MQIGKEDPLENGDPPGTSDEVKCRNEKNEKINPDKNGSKNLEVQQSLENEKSRNQKEINDYWKKVKGGPSGNIVKIKQEKTDSNNQYEVLEDKDEVKQDEIVKNLESDSDDDLGDIYGVDEDFSAEEDVTIYPGIAKDALLEVNEKNIEDLKHYELSETMFCVMRCKNHKLKRAEVYRQKTEWLKKALKKNLKYIVMKLSLKISMSCQIKFEH